MEQTPVIMVCVTGQLTCENLIYGALKIVEEEELGRAEIKVVHVAKMDEKLLGYNNDWEAIEFLYQLSKSYGADMTVIRAENVIDALVEYAESVHAAVVLMGMHKPGVPGRVAIQVQERLPNSEVRVLDRKLDLKPSAVRYLPHIAQFDY